MGFYNVAGAAHTDTQDREQFPSYFKATTF